MMQALARRRETGQGVGAAPARSRGFTLIELIIVVLIVGVLVAFAFPSYQQYVQRGHRAEGKALLSDAAARQERYFAQNNSYVTSSTDLDKLGLTITGGGVDSLTGRYRMTVSNTDDYTLTATPLAPHTDPECGNLTLAADGTRGATATGADVNECWR